MTSSAALQRVRFCNRVLPGSLGARAVLALSGIAVCLLVGCVSPRYKSADKKTPAATQLSLSFPPAHSIRASLETLITFGGPGSWKREAFWDEYVTTLTNQGEEPVRVDSAILADSADLPHSPGEDPWVLERQSKDLEKKYQEAGMAFARIAAPRVLVATAEPVVLTGAGVGSAGAAAAAATTAVALPVYGLTVWGMNRHNKAAINAEFMRRRMAFPVQLGPGETRTGSLFFPMIPNPRSLTLHWSHALDRGDSVLPLDVLTGLHMMAVR